VDVHLEAPGLPDIDSYDGLLHTLFALKDIYGLRTGHVEREPFLFVDKSERISKKANCSKSVSSFLMNNEILLHESL